MRSSNIAILLAVLMTLLPVVREGHMPLAFPYFNSKEYAKILFRIERQADTQFPPWHERRDEYGGKASLSPFLGEIIHNSLTNGISPPVSDPVQAFFFYNKKRVQGGAWPAGRPFSRLVERGQHAEAA
jgi:hypothetical protein